MIENPLISVYLLCFNHEKYIAQAIESVLNQTYNNWELIIVDNASTDKSRSIIEQYVGDDTRIKFFPLDINTYPSYGSNFAIKQAHGEYITPLCGDDYFKPNKIEKQLRFIQQNDIEVCFTWVKVVDDIGVELVGHWADVLFNRRFDNQLDLLGAFITQGNTLCAVTWMFRKKIFEEFGYFDNRLLQTQDFDLWLKIIRKYPITVMKEKLTNYRVRDDGGNLSIKINVNGQLRCITESIWYMQNICAFNAEIISQVLNIHCDEVSKYKALFNFYNSNGNLAYATAILLAMYNKLSADFSLPSQLYKDFLDIYSRFDIFGHFFINYATTQLFIAGSEEEFNELHSIIRRFEVSEKIFYDLTKYKNVKRLRFDPINQPAKINLEAVYFYLNDGSKIKIELDWHNADDLQDNIYDFKHDDPQLVFNIPEGYQRQIKAVEFIVDITPYNKIEILKLLRDVNNQSTDLKSELHDPNTKLIEAGNLLSATQVELMANQETLESTKVELDSTKVELESTKVELESTKVELDSTKVELGQICNSISWKVTKVLRVIMRVFK